MKLRRFGLVIAGFLVGLAPIAAQAAPAPAPVRGSAGPAWWRVSDADSEVWIIGTPEKMPVGTRFDAAAMTDHLAGAKFLIVPPPSEDDLSISLKASSQRRTADPTTGLAARLPPELYARVIKAFPRMETNLSTGGATWIIGDYRGMLDREPTIATADWLAAGAFQAVPLGNVAVNRAKTIVSGQKGEKPRIVTLQTGATGMRALLNVVDAPEALQQACLDYVLKNIEAGAGGAPSRQASIDAWTQGDVVHSLKRYSYLYGCPYGPVGNAFWAKVVGDYTKAISDALATPGKSVAVVEFDPMLMGGGVLQQLEAKGFKVQWPDEM